MSCGNKKSKAPRKTGGPSWSPPRTSGVSETSETPRASGVSGGQEILARGAEQINTFLQSLFLEKSQLPGLQSLEQSMKYSLLEGGKRFRPTLCLLTAEVFVRDPEWLLPFAAAIELVHTYSLIHDDLPCMDDDDFRRGRPSNHKKFGEATALLAGDALQAQAFYLLHSSYESSPGPALRAGMELSRALGPGGMVGGQALDLAFYRTPPSLQQLDQIHSMKTGALIRCAIVGAAQLLGAPREQIQRLQKFGEALGLAFQVADDILDRDQNSQVNYVQVLGLQGARDRLQDLSSQGLRELEIFGATAQSFRSLVEYNQLREN